MNSKRFIMILFTLGILDKLRFKKNSEKKNIKPDECKTESPSYINLEYEYKPRKQPRNIHKSTPQRKNKPRKQPRNIHKSTLEWKNCPKCNKKINKVAKKCPYCNYIIKEDHNSIEFITNSINTKFIKKNGLSFECPDYYDIVTFKSGDEVYKSIVALSKNDQECVTISVSEYRPGTFHWKARKNSLLIKKYLKLKGYDDVKLNRNLHYCFDATINTEIGKLKTTILYNFDTYKVFQIVCNRDYYSDYNCIYDIKIINDSIHLS